jgi:hypothetical protein
VARREAAPFGTGAEMVGMVLVLVDVEVGGWSAVDGAGAWCGTLSASSIVSGKELLRN